MTDPRIAIVRDWFQAARSERISYPGDDTCMWLLIRLDAHAASTPKLFKCPHCSADDVGEMDPYRCGICGKDRRVDPGPPGRLGSP